MNTPRQTVFLAPRYRHAWSAIAFLERCFGFERQAVHEAPDGSVAHGELRLGAACYGLSSAGTAIDPENPWTTVRSGIYVALPDPAAIDRHHTRAAAAGAEIAMPLEDTDYGSHQYSVWDCEHRLWCFGTYNYAPVAEPALHVLLRYPDPEAALSWLARAFGLAPRRHGSTGTTDDGYIRLEEDDVRLWLDATTAPAAHWGTEWHAGHVVVDDVAAHYSRARGGGATISRPLAPTGRGSESYGALDPEGYVWTFSSGLPGEL